MMSTTVKISGNGYSGTLMLPTVEAAKMAARINERNPKPADLHLVSIPHITHSRHHAYGEGVEEMRNS